jgi:hypothetical protein
VLTGYFGPGGRPYVAPLLALPVLRMPTRIELLLDTGSDESLLSPRHARDLGILLDRLQPSGSTVGIGGTIPRYQIDAALIFDDPDDGVRYLYRLSLGVSPPTPATLDLPSILGRDVLDRWRMTYDPSEGELTFEVRSADARLAIRA